MTLPMRFFPPSSILRNNPLLYAIPLPAAFYFASMSTSTHANDSPSNPSNTSTTSKSYPSSRPYTSRFKTFPYKPDDFRRADESEDEDFYSSPRFVTHIDDHAIGVLKKYYSAELPRKGRILDLCSSWISHFPLEIEERARESITTKNAVIAGVEREADDAEAQKLTVIGLGMNQKELDANPILRQRVLRNLNITPRIPDQLAPLDATVCVVSIDYLTSPLEVLTSIYKATRSGGAIHLVISNRCFPTKAVGRWLRVGEQERLNMVGEYLWWSGWRRLEIVELCDGSVEEGEGAGETGGLKGGLSELMRSIGMEGGRVDPLWVVRGLKIEGEGHGGQEIKKSEL